MSSKAGRQLESRRGLNVYGDLGDVAAYRNGGMVLISKRVWRNETRDDAQRKNDLIEARTPSQAYRRLIGGRCLSVQVWAGLTG